MFARRVSEATSYELFNCGFFAKFLYRLVLLKGLTPLILENYEMLL